MFFNYDIIIVGAGHSGCEAASAAANMGSKVLLITMDMTKIAQMSCNPAMGGIAKGQIIREIDALGGFSGIVTDNSMIQFRMLNKSKGPAMWSPRAQCDRTKFTVEWRKILEDNFNIDLWQDTVKELIFDGSKSKVIGVKTISDVSFFAKAVILTTGTFGNGLMHIGRIKLKGGRISEYASYGISDQLNDVGFRVGRMKTGTPARIDSRTINFNKLIEQKGDECGGKFSYLTNKDIQTNFSCFITYTNSQTHRVIERGFKDSPLYNGTINSIGPRYCPSIEDKIVTFASKESHQLFLEPEGENTVEFYINGFSSSLPWNIQYEALRTIDGLENVKIFRPGYAIEYDFYPPDQLESTLETRMIGNLYFAGQINGTTGYEEAGGQGLVAGINAHLKINSKEPFILSRDEAYIGVLIDDLVTKGVDEPYRMFTSRAEYRLLLRQDNADERLTERSYNIGLASAERYSKYRKKQELKNKIINYLRQTSIEPSRVNSLLNSKNTSLIKQKTKLFELILRPQLSIRDFVSGFDIFSKENDFFSDYLSEILESVEIEIKYNGYFEREKLIAEKLKRLELVEINNNINFNEIKSISTEARQKLNRIKPKTIGQAARISGVSPSDINVLLAYLGR